MDYSNLPPIEKLSADIIEGLGIKAPLKNGGIEFPHVAGYESLIAQRALMSKGYGTAPLFKFGPLKEDQIRIYGWFGTCGHPWGRPCSIGQHCFGHLCYNY